MFNHHPLDVEFFDYNVFETENYASLKSLLKEVCEIVPGSWSNDDVVKERACLMTIAVYSDLSTFNSGEVEVADDLGDNEEAAAFFDKMLITCLYMHLEDMGIAERGPNGGWRLTAFGRQHSARLAKRLNGLQKLVQATEKQNELETDKLGSDDHRSSPSSSDAGRENGATVRRLGHDPKRT